MQATWCMSSGLRAHLLDLSQRADRLQVAAVELAEEIVALSEPGAFGDWCLVKEAYKPLAEDQLEEVAGLLRYRGLEEGPPELPKFLFRQVRAALNCDNGEAWTRGDNAFFAGFFADIALKTHTPYKQRDLPVEREPLHWVVIYRIHRHLSRRVSSTRCLELALECESDPIWEAFHTAAELATFCVGAQIEVPKLEKWISPW